MRAGGINRRHRARRTTQQRRRHGQDPTIAPSPSHPPLTGRAPCLTRTLRIRPSRVPADRPDAISARPIGGTHAQPDRRRAVPDRHPFRHRQHRPAGRADRPDRRARSTARSTRCWRSWPLVWLVMAWRAAPVVALWPTRRRRAASGAGPDAPGVPARRLRGHGREPDRGRPEARPRREVAGDRASSG